LTCHSTTVIYKTRVKSSNQVMPESKNLQRLTKPEKPRKTKKCEVMQQ